MKILSFILSILFTITFVNAYFAKTHSYLGYTLQKYLLKNNKTLYDKIHKMTNINDYKSASVWADKIKFNKQYIWSKNLHFIDVYECGINSTVDFDEKLVDKYCDTNCVITAILNMTNTLYNHYKYPNQKSDNHNFVLNSTESFNFLIHFLQDLTQPMHILGFNRGGNTDKIKLVINKKEVYTNLHTIWDHFLPEYFIDTEKFSENLGKWHKDITNFYEYKDYLLEKSNIIYKIGCLYAYRHSDIINFDEYYHKDIIKDMFVTYMELALNTLHYIYN